MIFKIVIIGMGGAILAVLTKQFQKEYSVFVLFAVCLFLIGYLTSNVAIIVEFVETLSEKIQISSTYLKILFKLLAIAYICQITSNLCQDLGYQSISFQIEMLGKISILILSIPIMNSLLETMETIL